MTARALASVALILLFNGEDAHNHAPFAEALIAVAADAGEGSRKADAGTLAELSAVARLVRLAEGTTHSRVAALNGTIFGTLGFVREVNDTDLRFVLLPSVLRERRGSCVGLGALYIALGEQLGWKVDGVMMPGHFYVRVGDGGVTHNVELLRRGEEMPSTWYDGRFTIPGRGAAEYRRVLSHREVLAIALYDVGNERRRQGRLAEARRAYGLSTALFPGFSEAHASLGATEQLVGLLGDAKRSYRAARAVNPDLPGIDHNLELLDAEVARSAKRDY